MCCWCFLTHNCVHLACVCEHYTAYVVGIEHRKCTEINLGVVVDRADVVACHKSSAYIVCMYWTQQVSISTHDIVCICCLPMDHGFYLQGESRVSIKIFFFFFANKQEKINVNCSTCKLHNDTTSRSYSAKVYQDKKKNCCQLAVVLIYVIPQYYKCSQYEHEDCPKL